MCMHTDMRMSMRMSMPMHMCTCMYIHTRMCMYMHACAGEAPGPLDISLYGSPICIHT